MAPENARSPSPCWIDFFQTVIGLNKTARVDAQSRRTEYVYDDRHRLTNTNYIARTADNRQRTYDDVGNLLTVSFPNNGDTGQENNFDFFAKA